MKSMNNVQDGKGLGLKEKLLRKLGNSLADVEGPCTLWLWYEPDFPTEVDADISAD